MRFLEKPPKNIGTIGVYIQFAKFLSNKKYKTAKKKKIYETPYGTFDSEKFRKVIDKTFGIAPDLPDGVTYENEMRKKTNWERKYEW